MAYENGKKINRYFNQQKGIQKSKCKANSYYDFYWDKERYWKFCYLSGCRKFAKRQTNRKIRNNKNLELTNPSDYRKVFDYDWTIW